MRGGLTQANDLLFYFAINSTLDRIPFDETDRKLRNRNRPTEQTDQILSPTTNSQLLASIAHSTALTYSHSLPRLPRESSISYRANSRLISVVAFTLIVGHQNSLRKTQPTAIDSLSVGPTTATFAICSTTTHSFCRIQFFY